MGLLNTLLRTTNFSNPFLRTIVPSIGLAYGIQSAFAVPSIITQSDRFYDLSGSLTYLACTGLSLYLPTLRARAAASGAGLPKPGFPSLLGAVAGNTIAWNWRQVLLSAAVGIWATRCLFAQNNLFDFAMFALELPS
jgi:hypothetical protein